MSYAMRRELCREATGPTPEEFAAEGATFLVGMVRAAYPDRLAPQYAVTPRDDWFYPYAYVDDIGILVGDLMGNLFGQDKTPEEVRAAAEARELRQARRAEDRAEARAERRENRSRQAANAFIRWFEDRGGDVTDTWTVPNGMGHGVFAEAEDEFTLGAFRKKAREIAAMYRVYFSIVPLPGVSEYLVAFVSEARYTPLSFEDAVSLAEVATDLETDAEVEAPKAGMIHVSVPTVDGVGSLGGAAVGSIFKKLFGPKKPEAIKKRIEKLEAELSDLRSKLAEAESKASAASEGIVVGNIYSRFRAAEGPEYGESSPGMFRRAAEGPEYGDSSPAVFRRAGGPEYGESSPGMFRRAASSYDYGEMDDPDVFRDATFGDFSGAAMTRDEMEDAAVDALEAMLEDGEISQRAFEAFCDRIPDLSDEELTELLADLTGEDAAGFVPVPTTATATMSRSSKRKLRRQTRRSRRKSRRKARLTRRALRKALRQSTKKKKSKSPKVIVIRQGGDDGGDDDDQPQIINIDSGDDDDDESDGVGAFAYGGPGYGDAALRMGRNFDLPRSPNGFVINYPVG